MNPTPSNSPSRILVLGGTGFVGRSVCEKLVERSNGAGGRIVVPSRRPHRAQHLRTLPTVELVAADVVELAPQLDPSGVSAVLAAKVVRSLLLLLARS